MVSAAIGLSNAAGYRMDQLKEIVEMGKFISDEMKQKIYKIVIRQMIGF